ncbi:MAG: hypothetical protein WCH46_07400 [bacterium]
MTTKNRAYSFFKTIGIILPLLLFISQARAQCPSIPCPNPGNCTGWSSVTGVPVHISSGCDLYVNYCYRTVHNWPTTGFETLQAVITEIDSDAHCDDDITTASFVAEVQSAISVDASTHAVSPPPCNNQVSGSYKMELRTPACLKRVATSYNHYALVMACESTTSFCLMTCDLCHDSNGTTLKQNCTFTLEGTPPCDDAPTKMGDWPTDACRHPVCGTF